MEFKKQVCSLRLSKKLKKLGVKQKSLWWWIGKELMISQAITEYANDANESFYQGCGCCSGWLDNEEKVYSTFTVAELGEILPIDCCYTIKKDLDEGGESIWECNYIYYAGNDKGDEVEVFLASTEADARAKCLVYLLEHNIIKQKEK